jgi:hypothetical protein
MSLFNIWANFVLFRENVPGCQIAKTLSIFYFCQADGHLCVCTLASSVDGKWIKNKNHLALLAFCLEVVCVWWQSGWLRTFNYLCFLFFKLFYFLLFFLIFIFFIIYMCIQSLFPCITNRAKSSQKDGNLFDY